MLLARPDIQRYFPHHADNTAFLWFVTALLARPLDGARDMIELNVRIEECRPALVREALLRQQQPARPREEWLPPLPPTNSYARGGTGRHQSA